MKTPAHGRSLGFTPLPETRSHNPVAKWRQNPKADKSSELKPVETGFTLAEVAVVVLLMVLIISAGAGVLIYNNRFYETQSGEIFSVNATREAADRLNEYGRQAVAVVSSYTYSSTSYITGGQTVIFQISSLDIDDAVIPGSYDYVIIGANPNTPSRLELIVDPALGSSRPARNLLLSGKLTTVNFVYDNSDFALTRRVDYTILVTDVGRSPGQEQISGSVTLRNK